MFFLNLIINKKGLLKYLRFLLFPLAFLYGTIAHIRNLFFHFGFFSSKNFRTPSIGVGNLSMGGTGKSVVVTYLIEIHQKTKTIATITTTELLTQPLVMEESEALKVQASDANELHVIASILEIQPREVTT